VTKKDIRLGGAKVFAEGDAGETKRSRVVSSFFHQTDGTETNIACTDLYVKDSAIPSCV